ncbi:hypothetical protein Pint_11525 [Pistacia integerrima]|uniref:Uncharacterized protein n=1 Tax=Pistacia integerrima TaxID=434235 RepID=A0ACC0XH29_9ROSI|nr:hypothetical protein Pint_11525 [Pistacia integerrima]
MAETIVSAIAEQVLDVLDEIEVEDLCKQVVNRQGITRKISECPRLISLPCGVRRLSSLEDLLLISCERLNLDLSIGSNKQDNHDELSSTWPHLQFLHIRELPQLVEFPEWLLQCSTNTLERLEILNCSNLKALPELMQKLQINILIRALIIAFADSRLAIKCGGKQLRVNNIVYEADDGGASFNVLNPEKWALSNGTRQLKDFDITKKASGFIRAIRRSFDANVTDNHLEIQLFWVGKGTCCVPVAGSYGPLISALSVTPEFQPTIGLEQKKNRTRLIVTITVPLVIFGIIPKFLVLYLRMRKDKDDTEVLHGIGPKPKNFTYVELKSATKDLVSHFSETFYFD